MGLFSFGGSKSKSSSNSSSNTFVDPDQKPYLSDIRNQARGLNSQGMPVEGVANFNPTLQNAMNMANQGGQMQAGAGAGLMGAGSAQIQGTGQALNFANNAMQGGASQGYNSLDKQVITTQVVWQE